MHGFLKHEFLKSRSLFLILTLCLAALLSCYFLYTGRVLSKMDPAANQRAAYSDKINQLENSVANYFEKSGLPPADGKGKEISANLDAQKKLLQNMTDANFKGDWKTELSEAIEQVKLEQALTTMGVLPFNYYLAQTLKQDQYFLSNSIKPKNPAACDGLNVLAMISRKFLPVLLPACTLLLSLGAWLSEKRSGALKLLLWQARPKRKILLDKFLVSWLEAMAAIVVSCLIVFIACLPLFGPGELRYPIFTDSGRILITGNIILQAAETIPAETLVLTAVCSLTAGGIVLNPESI